MSIDKGAPPRLDPQQLVVLKLFEIADRLADQVPRGKLSSKQFTVDTNWYHFEGGWIAADIFNDGDSDIYIKFEDEIGGDRPWQTQEAPLKKGESIRLDLRSKLHRVVDDGVSGAKDYGPPTLCFICQAGTATVRAFKLL